LQENIRTAFSKFTNFTDTEWLDFSECFKTKHYKKGEYFIKEQAHCNYVGFIVKGLFNYYYLIDGVQHTRQFFFAHNFISDYSSFLLSRKSKAYIQALEDSSVILIHKNDLAIHYEKIPKIQKLGRKMAEYLYIIVSEKYESFLLKTAEERYLELIKSRPKVIKHIPQYMIASYLGITPEGLSRIRKRIAKK
jgi:CRP-like cAMP-binding protein